MSRARHRHHWHLPESGDSHLRSSPTAQLVVPACSAAERPHQPASQSSTSCCCPVPKPGWDGPCARAPGAPRKMPTMSFPAWGPVTLGRASVGRGAFSDCCSALTAFLGPWSPHPCAVCPWPRPGTEQGAGQGLKSTLSWCQSVQKCVCSSDGPRCRCPAPPARPFWGHLYPGPGPGRCMGHPAAGAVPGLPTVTKLGEQFI